MSSHGANTLQSHVLTLNRMYVACQVMSVRRAICLLWKGLAEVVNVEDGRYYSYDFRSWQEVSELKVAMEERQDEDDWIHSVSFELQVPRIIRLLRYDRLPRPVIKFNRRNIFLRDRNRCQYCDKRFPQSELSLDHVVPRSRGGQATWDNIVCACLKCNVRKGGRTPHEAGMQLQTQPRKPTRNPLLSQKLGSRKYASWKDFLDEAYWTTELEN